MSHYTMLVAAKDTGELSEKLLPYYEYGCGEYDELVKPYLVFKDCTEEIDESYEDTIERVVVIDGNENPRLVSKYDGMFRIPYKRGDDICSMSHEIPKELSVIDVPHKALYKSKDDFVTEWHGYEYNKELGVYGYWHNPNKKWDWYVVGGRWEGLLLLKDGSGTTNQALAGDIDWERIRNKKIDDIWINWKEYLSNAYLPYILWYTGVGKIWEAAYGILLKINRKFALKTKEIFWKVSRKLKRGKSGKEFKDPDWDLGIELGELPWDTIRRRTASYTWGIVTRDGEWLKKATMGWFGMSHGNQGRKFYKACHKEIKSFDDDQMVYVVDCHI